MGFDQQSVENNGGVAWAKQVAEALDPGAIGEQIQAYQAAVKSLAHIQTTLQNVKNNLTSTWSGDAAEAAQQSFQGSINHTDVVQELITGQVIPALQDAESAAVTYVRAMAHVPDEVSVPGNNVVNDVQNWFGQNTSRDQAIAHNNAAQTQAANALNALSDKYGASAQKLDAVQGTTFHQTTPDTNAFNLGSTAVSSGTGAAADYHSTVSSRTVGSTGGGTVGGSTGSVSVSRVVGGGGTTRSGTGTGSTTPTNLPTSVDPGTVVASAPSSPTSTPTAPTTVPVGVVVSGSGGAGHGYTGGVLGTGYYSGTGGDPLGDEVGSGSGGSGSGVFGETGFGDSDGLSGGTGSGLRGSSSTSTGDGSALVDDVAQPTGSDAGEGAGTGESEGMMAPGAGGFGGSGGEELGPSRYSRGQFLGGDEIDDPGQDLNGRVRSVYEGATDAQGNPLEMMGPGRRNGERDEDEERGKRPAYLREEEFWNSAQRIVPPVIE